jgi:hypothetical protein
MESKMKKYEDWGQAEAREAGSIEAAYENLPHFCKTCQATKCEGCEFKILEGIIRSHAQVIFDKQAEICRLKIELSKKAGR